MLCAVAAFAVTGSLNAWAQSKPSAQDTTGALGKYDILGVKLGMTEGEAVATIKNRFPAGAKDGRGRPINLKQSDYMLTKSEQSPADSRRCAIRHAS
jgi:hypothetical protein